jgi:hypothetical protein
VDLDFPDSSPSFDVDGLLMKARRNSWNYRARSITLAAAGVAIIVAASLIVSHQVTRPSGTKGRKVESASQLPVHQSRLTHSLTFAHGQVVVRPIGFTLPAQINSVTRGYHATLTEGVQMVESADPQLWPNTGLRRSTGDEISARSAYGLVTVTPSLRPTDSLGTNTFAWVVFYRVHLRSGCWTGWRLYVNPLLRPGVSYGYVGQTYIVMTPDDATCSTTPASSFVAYPHVSVHWRLVSRRGQTATISYGGECSPAPRVLGPVTNDTVARLQVVLPIADVGCPATPPIRQRVSNIPVDVKLSHGPTGALPIEAQPNAPDRP